MTESDDDMFAGGPPATSASRKPSLFDDLIPPKAINPPQQAEPSKRPAAGEGGGEEEAQLAKRARGADGGSGGNAVTVNGGSAGVADQPAAQQPATASAGGEAEAAIPLAAAYSEDKGSRKEQEDVAVILLDARRDQAGAGRLSFFGVFDGHGGRRVSQHAADHLHAAVLDAGLATEAQGAGTPSIKACRAAITAGFKKLDEEVLKTCAAEGWIDGATAVATWVVGNTVLVANVGDARAVLARRPQPAAAAVSPAAEGSGGAAASAGGGAGRAAPAQAAQQQQGSDQARAGPAPGQQPTARPAAGAADGAQQLEQLKGVTLTREHKAIFPQERQRIERAGGFVSADGRLGGRVEVSRAFGDRAFKKQGMSALPDIQAFTLSEREAFLLMGCDGFWGVFPPQDAVDFAAREMAKGHDVKQTCNRLIYEAIRERHGKDNTTVMLVKFG